MVPGSTSFVTIAPAPIIALGPIFTLGKIIAFAPINTLSNISQHPLYPTI